MTNNVKIVTENNNTGFSFSPIAQVSTYSLHDESIHGDVFVVFPNEKNIEVIINDDVTVVRDRRSKKKVVLRKCDLDEEDREKAILYGLLKLAGYKKAALDRIINNARDCRTKDDEESN